MSVNPGEKISIMGHSGSGKTSLLMVISGLEQASSGSIVIDGNDITSWSEDQLALFRCDMVGIVFQNSHLIPTMAALENITILLAF